MIVKNNILDTLILLYLLLPCIAQEPVVDLPQGKIVGTKVYSDKSLIPIEIYYGIPYATSPMGRYRYSPPERHAGWKNVLFAYRPPPRCPDYKNNNISEGNISEDCLFLNIWTQRVTAADKALPVVVILYSETWTDGGVSLPCQDLAAEGIVVVTVGFRLHLLSYFNLGTVAARGNLALLDQYMAFLWVRDHISIFGGDPTTITVLGYSAGADSVLHHIGSPRSNGLFQKAIIMSPRDIWELISEKRVPDIDSIRNISRQIAFSLGCRSIVDHEILQCMRSRSLTEILSVSLDRNWNKILQPVPDNYLLESEQYLPYSLYTALSTMKHTMQFDILLGTNDLEALNYNDDTFKEFLKLNVSEMSEIINNEIIPKLIILFSQQHRAELLPMLVRAVRWEYWRESSRLRGTDNVHDLIEYLGRVQTSARWSTGAALLAARLARRVAHLYVYRYSVPGTVDIYGRRINFTGAAHGSDLISLFCEALMPQIVRRPASAKEKQYSSIFRQYIINFIKYGHPDDNNIWKRYRAGDAHIYEISETQKNNLRENVAGRDVQFWLHYLPELSNAFNNIEQSEQYATLEKNGGRLRGGVFAMCGVAVVLLLLLFVSVIILHRQRAKRRFSITDDKQLNTK